MKKANLLIAALTLGFCLFAFFALVAPVKAKTPEEKGKYVGAETCATCHEDVAASFQKTIHGQPGKTDSKDKVVGCETCHGPGSAHVDAGGGKGTIFSFNGNVPAAEKSGKCLDCHNKNSATFVFNSSEHMKGSVSCSDCHDVHAAAGKDKLLSKEGSQLCLGCHREIGAKIMLNERHRISEGIVQCTDCHKNHEPASRAHLGGFSQETCFKCHTDKQGPYIYEHGAVRVEGCSACHDPHGSVNRHMLTHQRTAELCFSCHPDAPSFHTRFDPTTNCTNCHSAIHGSQLDAFFLK